MTTTYYEYQRQIESFLSLLSLTINNVAQNIAPSFILSKCVFCETLQIHNNSAVSTDTHMFTYLHFPTFLHTIMF